MDNETQNQITEELVSEPAKRDYLLPASILLSAIIIAGAWMYTAGLKVSNAPQKKVTSTVFY